MNKLDEFLKKKVEDLAVEPRAEAWSKLESNLSKKNNTLIWFRAAAALLLMGLLITTILWLQRTDDNQSLAERTIKANSSKRKAEVNPNQNQVAPTKAIKKSSNAEVKKEQNSKRQKTDKSQIVPTIEAEPSIEIKSESVQLEPTPIETVAAVPAVEKPLVIEYTLETIPLRKKETPAVAAVEKKNSLQKAIEFAREAKNSDSPLGGLRQAKDDLFALNFKKDKQKKQ